MKFIHIADLHLGCSTFNSKRELDFWNNFELVLKFAKDNLDKNDFIIIAGDVFDNRIINPSILYNFIKLVSPIQQKIYVISGNHDRQTKGSMGWLEYLGKQGYIQYIDSDKIIHDDVVIYGFENFKKLKSFDKPFERGKYNILMLHEGLTGYMDFVPGIDKEEFEKFNFNYIALGHYHMKYEFRNIYNPGSIERCSISEIGGGYFLVDVDTKEVKFFDLPKRPISRLVLDITNVVDDKDLSVKIEGLISSLSDDYIIEITLTGKTKLILNYQAVLEKLNKKWFYVKIRNHSISNEINIPDEKNNDNFESQIIEQFVGKDKVGKVLELKKIINQNPSVEEIREIFK